MGLDPVLGGVVFRAACSISAAWRFYQVYFLSFERRGRSNTLQSFTFFFGVALVLEVALILVAGVDLTSVSAPISARA